MKQYKDPKSLVRCEICGKVEKETEMILVETFGELVIVCPECESKVKW